MIETPETLIQGVQVEQGLRGMLVVAIARVDDRHGLGCLRRLLRRTNLIVTQHNGVAVGFEDANGVLKRFSLIDRGDRLGILHIERLPAQSLHSCRERSEGSTGWLKEEQRDELAREQLRRLVIEHKPLHVLGCGKKNLQIIYRELFKTHDVLSSLISIDRLQYSLPDRQCYLSHEENPLTFLP